MGCTEWLDIVIDTMVKSCRFVPKCGSARRLAGVALDKKMKSANLPQLAAGTKYWRSPGFFPPGNGRGIFLKPSAIVVAKNEDQGGLKL